MDLNTVLQILDSAWKEHLLAMDHLPWLRNQLAERTLGWVKR